MNTPEPCPRCGAPLPADAPAGLCPACLMSSAAETIATDSPTQSPLKEPRLSGFPCDFGGYRVLDLLGRGGMGTVYEAEQKSTGRRVALKVLGHELDSEEMRKRFLREGRLAAAVTHPNSLYIFGTEEIEGSPVIVMEIAGGGTLKDEVKRRGPLPVREAVDAILQIIAGLEAAQAGGVLHRDVKPANCFLAPDGTAKVGDFGLSVSTLAHQDTQLTASGMIMGTPSFAPPEQLKGEEMDLRSDLYSVGATLYTLLTGKAPFEGTNAVQVVAAVLDKAPKPVTEFRKDLPAGLAAVVGRCLAKKREDRFATYAELRDALLPFSSTVPTPAPIGLRVLAGFIDETVTSLPEVIVGFFVAGYLSDHFLVDRTLASFLPWFGLLFWYVAYYTVCEGLWGAGLGKALCGLRVVGPDRSAPGLVRALARCTCLLLACEIASIVALVSMSGAEYHARLVDDDGEWSWFLILFGIFLLSWFSLFLTMRRRNGFAAVHDLLSGTRVVLRPKTEARPRLEAAALPLPPEDGARLGPYRTVDAIGGGLFAGYDEVLRRPVWIRMSEAGAPPVSDARRAAARASRLRWIGGLRSESANWDAFEALPGRSLVDLEPQSQPWASVRLWLSDLTMELDAAEKDGTLPDAISPAHVWLTTDGRAVLHDEAWATESGEKDAANALTNPQHFLHEVVAQVLDPKTVPLDARDFLTKLQSSSFDRLSFVAGNLQSLLARPAGISPRRRAASLLFAPVVLVFSFALVQFGIHADEGRKDAKWRELHPDLPPLSQVLRLMYASDPDEGPLFAWRPDSAVHHATQIHVAGHYRSRLVEVVTRPREESPEVPLSGDEHLLIRMHFAAYPEPSEDELARVDGILKAELPKFTKEEERRVWLTSLYALKNVLAAIAVIQLFSLLLFGITPGQKIFGFAVVNKRGERAGRLRMLGRWTLAWFAFFIVFAKLEIVLSANRDLTTAELVKCLLYGTLWILCVIAAILRPQQGLHDDQAKTWLVPR